MCVCVCVCARARVIKCYSNLVTYRKYVESIKTKEARIIVVVFVVVFVVVVVVVHFT